MKHRKIRKGVSKYIRAASKDYAEEFHPFYVQLLLESGLTLEESLALLAEGALRPTDLPLSGRPVLYPNIGSATARAGEVS